MGEEEEKKVEEGGEKKEEKKQDGGEKKPEEGASAGKEEEEKKKPEAAGDSGEKKDTPAPPPPPPEEIVIRVFMHCEGCARKVKRSLRGFEGVEDVKTDSKTHKVVVKGKVAAADPVKVAERIQKKTGRKVELLTPIPPKPEKKEEKEVEKGKPKEEKKEEPPVIAVILKVHMHCEACSQEIKKRILKMKGVESADPDLKASQVMVKGVFDPPKLVDYVYKRTGKHALIVKQETVEKKAGDENKDGKPAAAAAADAAGGEKDDKSASAGGEGEKKDGGEEEKKKEGGGTDDPAAAAVTAATATAAKLVEIMNKNELNYYYPRYPVQYAYPPQIFSDENPNACSVM